jgi:hypothetical protein
MIQNVPSAAINIQVIKKFPAMRTKNSVNIPELWPFLMHCNQGNILITHFIKIHLNILWTDVSKVESFREIFRNKFRKHFFRTKFRKHLFPLTYMLNSPVISFLLYTRFKPSNLYENRSICLFVSQSVCLFVRLYDNKSTRTERILTKLSCKRSGLMLYTSR